MQAAQSSVAPLHLTCQPTVRLSHQLSHRGKFSGDNAAAGDDSAVDDTSVMA